jgi:hypothetical protein
VSNPLSNKVIDELINEGYERNDLDYKESLNLKERRQLLELAKDIFGFANSGGGYIVIGVTDEGVPQGLPLDFHEDQADIDNRVNKYLNRPVYFQYREVIRTIGNEQKKFGILYVQPSEWVIVPSKDGVYRHKKKTKQVFLANLHVFVRKDAKTTPASSEDYDRLAKQIAVLRQSHFTKQRTPARKYVKPLKKKEQIVTNLFPFEYYAERIWSIPTRFRNYLNAIEYLAEINKPSKDSFILRNKRLYTFSNLSDTNNALLNLASKNELIEEHISDWQSDLNKWRWFIQLMNIITRRFLQSKGFTYHSEISAYSYRLEPGKKTERVTWRPDYRRTRERQLAKAYFKEDGSLSYVAHRGFSCSVQTIGSELYLKLEPSWIFTQDGYRTLVHPKGRGKLSIQFERRDRNDQLITLILFWIASLTSEKKQIEILESGKTVARISAIPLGEKIGVGIEDSKLGIASRATASPSLDLFFRRTDNIKGE